MTSIKSITLTILFQLYQLSLSSTKLSILLLYLRIFPQQLFRKACHYMMWIVGVYALWTVVSSIVMCFPIPYFWTQIKDPYSGHCLPRFPVW